MKSFGLSLENPDWGKDLSFGQALQTIRRNQGLSMIKLTKLSGVSQSYISQLENDVRLPSDDVIKKLSLALVSVDPITDIKDLDKEISENNSPNKIYTALSRVRDNTKLTDYLVNKIDEDAGFVAEIKSLSKKDIELIDRFDSLNVEQQKHITSYLDYLIYTNKHNPTS